MAEKRSKTSLAFRLNATLFFRQLRFLFCLDILICGLFLAGLLFYVENVAYSLMEEYGAETSLSAEVGTPEAGAEAEAEAGAGRRNGTRNAAAAAQPNSPATAADEEILLRAAGYTLARVKTPPPSLAPPADWARFLPEPASQAGRWLYIDEATPGTFRQLRTLIYQISLPENPAETGAAADPDVSPDHGVSPPPDVSPDPDTWAYIDDPPPSDGPAFSLTPPTQTWLVVSAPVGLPLTAFSYVFLVVLIAEGLHLLFSLGRNGRSITRTLRPLQELTETAKALTAAGRRLPPEAMKRLTGALDSIDANRLDARIPLAPIGDELKPLAAAINEMLTRIDDAYRSQIRFVSDASHELRTPIAVIQGYASLLSRWGAEDPATMRESVQAIHQEADAMKDMVEQLLFLARGDNDSIRLEWVPVDVSALAAEVLREVEMIDQAHQFAATILPAVRVMGDAGLLKQLLRILTDNSIKYTAAGGQIQLRVGLRQDHASIIVQDEGAGIPPAALPHIFDRFYRADESRTRNTGGTGLGLAIAKWIAERHDGCVLVTSRENIGTRMTVLLPLTGGGSGDTAAAAGDTAKAGATATAIT